MSGIRCTSHIASMLLITAFAVFALGSATPAQYGCRQALAQRTVCHAASSLAVDMMRNRHLQAATVAQDVATGSLIVFASSQPASLDISTQVLPLSLSKLYLAASWWDHSAGINNSAPKMQPNVHEMLVGGSDSAGRQLAIALRNAVGTQTVLTDLDRYGFDGRNDKFWAELPTEWRVRLVPHPASVSLLNVDDQQWAAALSIGESHMTTTLLHQSRFLQAVGNNGIECEPIAIESAAEHKEARCIAPRRIVSELTAKRLMQAMLDTVKRGSAVRIANTLQGTGWAIGGKDRYRRHRWSAD